VDSNHIAKQSDLKNMLFDNGAIGLTPDQVVEKYGKFNSAIIKKDSCVKSMIYSKVAVDTVYNKKFVYKKTNYRYAKLLFIDGKCKKSLTFMF